MYKDYEDNSNLKSDKKNKIINCSIVLLIIIIGILLLFLNKKDKYEIDIKEKEIIVERGNYYQIKTKEDLEYKIADLSIARINDEGNIIGIKEGSTNLIITSDKTNDYKVVKVSVKKNENEKIEEVEVETEEKENIKQEDIKKEENVEIIPEVKVDEKEEEKEEKIVNPENIVLNINNKELYVGEEILLIATIYPNNSTNKNIIWKSSDNSIATVENGKVKTLEAGKVVITAKTLNDKVDSCTINVKEKIIDVSNITLNKTSEVLNIGDTIELKETITPSNATNKIVTWTSTNSSVASVDSNGIVKGKKEGISLIIVKTSNGKTASCQVKVTKKEEIITESKPEPIVEPKPNNGIINITWTKGIENIVAGGGASRVYSLPNGKLIGASEVDGKIYSVISLDNGNTWSNPVLAASIDNKMAANINFFYDKGILYMAYRATSGCDDNKNKCYTSLNVNVSNDEGLSWKYHSKIIENTMSSKRENRGYWEPYLGLINNNLTVFYANDSKSSNWQNIESLTWNGSSWTNKQIISNGKSHNSRDGMPVWTRLSNGTYALVMESSKYRRNHPFVIQILYSKDGVKWSNPKDIYIPNGKGSKASAPGIVELPNGQLVVSFQTDEDSNKKGDIYSICKTIYSDGTNIELVTKNNFSKSETVFTTTSGMWPAIHYNNNWLYVAGGDKFKKISV